MLFLLKLKVILIILAAMLCISGCKISETEQRDRNQLPAVRPPDNLFNVPGQMVSSDLVRSIQLAKAGNPASAPIIDVNSNEQLQLQFEMLEYHNRQLRIQFTHHNPDWSRSSVPPEFFLDRVFTLYLDSGMLNHGTQRPQYRQYSYTFPNQQFSFTKSGNYMLQIEDSDTGYLLFSLPFFVMENEGTIVSSVESITTPRRDLRISHRPVSRYILTDETDLPQFDLEFYFVQNQFWGRARKATETDFSSPVEVYFELDRNRPFTGDYEFLELRLDNLSLQNPQVLEILPQEIPPRLLLFDDISGFASTGRLLNFGRFGNPDIRLNASYANVVFTFDPGDLESETDIYLLGDFNNWSLHSRNRLRYSEDKGRWQASSIIKAGTYHYKYVLIDENGIDDLRFDDLFTRTPQEYHALVYKRDSREFYYRLLQTNQFFSGS
jgi:hypothetical protein